jgi:antitoxin ParD1/3/4
MIERKTPRKLQHFRSFLSIDKSGPYLVALAIFAKSVTICSKLPIRRSVTMPTRNVNLTEELERFVLTKVESGRYENASEVVRAALRILAREEEQYEVKLAALRAAVDEGDASGIVRGNAFARVRKTLKLPVTRR